MFLVSRFSASDLCWETSANLKIRFEAWTARTIRHARKPKPSAAARWGTFVERNRIRAGPPSGGPVARNFLFLTKDHEQR
jgi:hypothetical protein